MKKEGREITDGERQGTDGGDEKGKKKLVAGCEWRGRRGN